MDEEADEAVGGELTRDRASMSSVLGDAYRGELDRETTWRSRLDQTTTWSVTVMAAILTWAFSSQDNPHYIILVAVIATTIFLGMEARRYRDYDVYRARVRLLQENLLAMALDPDREPIHENWRKELSEDYRHPRIKISMLEAVSNRLRRVYLALLTLLVFAWFFRISAFETPDPWYVTAAIATVPGWVIVAVVAVGYLLAVTLALWPSNRQAKGEFRSGEPGAWKNDS